MTFVEACKFVLEKNLNIPLTSAEIWQQIKDLNLVETKGKTPELSVNRILCSYSINLEDISPDRKPRNKSEMKNSIFRIYSTNPYKFILNRYLSENVKETLISNGFITIEQLKEILEKNNIKITI